MQVTDTLIMVSPDHFQFNEETAVTNKFQKNSAKNVRELALNEFTQMVSLLKKHNIRVITLDSPSTITPDAVFPNNWFSIHTLKNNKITLVLYPMLNKNRQAERQVDNLIKELAANNIIISDIIDLTHFENQNLALEGTGSLILDRKNNLAYAAISQRTNKTVLNEFIKKLEYKPILFHSYDHDGFPIYHTNVIMSVGTNFAAICLASITNKDEKAQVIAALQNSNKTIIDITLDQVQQMAGNILEVRSTDNNPKIILSKTAFDSFTDDQRKQLSNFAELIPVNIDTIEKCGGGSARCMLAEVFYTL